MSTKVEVKSEEVKLETVEVADAEAKAILEDTTIVSDRTFIKLMTEVDTHQSKVGGKWYSLIQHLIKTHLLYLQVDFKTLTPEQKEELKLGKKVILKSLLEMKKTPGSAQVIRSNIIRLAKPENREALEKMGRGEITVRAAREAGRKAQTVNSRSDEERYRSAIDTVCRYATGSLKYGTDQIYRDIAAKYAEYVKENGPTDEEKAAQKADFKAALKETEEQLAAKKS